MCMLCFSPKPQFFLMGALMFFGSFLLKKNEPGEGGKVSVH